eukprot:TRINITY_DN1028_c0_g1_i4.p1 TRINITY_DN1028_c0_g1~~TRINITY_DN1028_c0_g1_i4.p1  ORF type:complete len:209 (+),score=35.32 TRINITY_DN1028_c0_g1_i4:43-669(+)
MEGLKGYLKKNKNNPPRVIILEGSGLNISESYDNQGTKKAVLYLQKKFKSDDITLCVFSKNPELKTLKNVNFVTSANAIADIIIRHISLEEGKKQKKTMFRPCIDLHEGKVKQIVGSTLKDGQVPITNFVAEKTSEYFAQLYKKDELKGGHVIMLGPGNEEAALQALKAFPGGLQVGGGITPQNAQTYLDHKSLNRRLEITLFLPSHI